MRGVSAWARHFRPICVPIPALHREGWHLFLGRQVVGVVVARAGVDRSLAEILTDERLVVKFQAHAVGRTAHPIGYGVIIRARVLIPSGDVIPNRSTDTPASCPGLGSVDVGVI